MTLVVDASVVVAALVDGGDTGRWAVELFGAGPLAAPQLLPVEVANVLRRSQLAGQISADVASLAHADLLDLRIELLPYAAVAERTWELREAITPYDAWYVASAEVLEAPLATLDRKLARSRGARCRFLLPGEPVAPGP